MKYILLVLSLVVLVSCCGTSKTQQNDLAMNQQTANPTGKYQVISIEGKEIAPKDAMLNFSAENRLSGNAGCNDFSSTYTLEGEKMSFSPITATKMYCEGEMETEKSIFSVIARTNKIVSASNNEIVFVSENGEELLQAKKIK